MVGCSDHLGQAVLARGDHCSSRGRCARARAWWAREGPLLPQPLSPPTLLAAWLATRGQGSPWMWAMEVSAPPSRESRERGGGWTWGTRQGVTSMILRLGQSLLRWLNHTVTDVFSSLLPCPLISALNLPNRVFSAFLLPRWLALLENVTHYDKLVTVALG